MNKVLIYKIEANLGYDAFRVTYFYPSTGIISVVEETPDGKVLGGYTSYDTNLSSVQKQLEEAEKTIKRLSVVAMPSKVTKVEDLAQAMLEENCAIAKAYFNKVTT